MANISNSPNNPSTFLERYPDMLRNTATFLDAKDLASLRCTCKKIKKSLTEEDRRAAFEEASKIDWDGLSQIVPLFRYEWAKIPQSKLTKISSSSGKQNITGFKLGFIAEKCPLLKSLDLDGSFRLANEDFGPLRECKHLEELNLTRTAISGSGLRHLKELPLKSLTLRQCKNLTNDCLAHLNQHALLVFLDISLTDISDAGLIHLQNLSLRSLNLKNTDVSDGGVDFLLPLQELRHLNLSDCSNISDEALHYLRPLSKLCQLDLCDNAKITGNRLGFLPQSLKSLDVSGCKKIDNNALRNLRNFQLTHLGISKCSKVTDDGLLHLENHPLIVLIADDVDIDGHSLHWLWKAIETLSLRGTRITDQTLSILNDFPHLTQLNLSKTRITQKGLDALAQLNLLESLNLTNCSKISAIDLAQFVNKCKSLKQICHFNGWIPVDWYKNLSFYQKLGMRLSSLFSK